MNLRSVSKTIYLIFADCSDFNELKEIISNVKIKNNRSRCKIAKFALQIYAFV